MIRSFCISAGARPLALAAAVLALTGCPGGGGHPSAPTPPNPPPAPTPPNPPPAPAPPNPPPAPAPPNPPPAPAPPNPPPAPTPTVPPFAPRPTGPPTAPGPAGPPSGPAPAGRGLRIAAMHVTQGSQTADGRVPLVQDRDGCLRVFVLANAWSGPGPAVRVHVRDARGNEILVQDLPSPGRGVPAVLRDFATGQSWDLPLPGRLIQPGMTLQAELQMPPGDPALESGQGTFPHDGTPLRLQVQRVPPLRLTLIPIRTHGRVGRILEGGRTLDSWTESIRAMYPLAALDVQVGPTFDTRLDLGGPNDQLGEALDELEAWRLADGRNDDRYFYGVFVNTVPWRDMSMGMGLLAAPGSPENRTAIGHDLISRDRPRVHYAEILAHELGHNFGRLHSPCMTHPSDPDYPNGDGELDICGFDLRTGHPVDPASTTDIMGYCEHRWVSRYTYEGILAFREVDGALWRAARGPARAGSSAPEARDGLLVWGGSKAGRMTLTAALRVHRPPLPAVPGDYRLECLDGAGRVTQAVSFAPAQEPGQPGAARFALVVPMPPGGEAGLAAMRVSQGGQVRAVLRPASWRAHKGRAGHGPWARRGKGGTVHFSWDAGAFPRVLVREPGGGAALALGAGGSLDLRTQARTLDCTFSDGLHSIQHLVRVH